MSDQNEQETAAGFLFVELAEGALTEGKPFDGLAFGKFTDMYGREVTLDAADLEQYIANTAEAIEATRTESGELVGLPIDASGHDKGDGAGWIIGVAADGERLRIIPKWTEIGRELIGKGIRRFFSATVNVTRKIVLGGTLTNWPATRNEKGHVMLRPIELSDSMFTVSSEAQPGQGEKPMSDELKEKPVEQATSPEPAPVEETPAAPANTAELMEELFRQVPALGAKAPHELADLVGKLAKQQAEAQVRVLVEEQQRQWEIVELSAKLTGGGKRGLPVSIPELTAFLQSLDGPQLDQAKVIFGKITDTGLVEFAELGHGRRMHSKQRLPEVYHQSLREAVKAGSTFKDFFELAGLGNPDAYDLSQFGGSK